MLKTFPMIKFDSLAGFETIQDFGNNLGAYYGPVSVIKSPKGYCYLVVESYDGYNAVKISEQAASELAKLEYQKSEYHHEWER